MSNPPQPPTDLGALFATRKSKVKAVKVGAKEVKKPVAETAPEGGEGEEWKEDAEEVEVVATAGGAVATAIEEEEKQRVARTWGAASQAPAPAKTFLDVKKHDRMFPTMEKTGLKHGVQIGEPSKAQNVQSNQFAALGAAQDEDDEVQAYRVNPALVKKAQGASEAASLKADLQQNHGVKEPVEVGPTNAEKKEKEEKARKAAERKAEKEKVRLEKEAARAAKKGASYVAPELECPNKDKFSYGIFSSAACVEKYKQRPRPDQAAAM